MKGNGADVSKAPKNVGGRPTIPVDLVLLGDLASIHCTQAESAPILGISISTFEERLRTDKEFADVWHGRMAEGNMSLRRLQWEQAEGGSVAMAIWLGKQRLGQKDKQEVTGKDGASLVTYNLGGLALAGTDEGGNGTGDRKPSETSPVSGSDGG